METVKELTKEVVYVTTPEKAISYRWRDGYEKLNDGLEIVSIDDIPKMDNIMFTGKQGRVRVLVDSIWTKHPFIPNCYIEVNSSEDVIARSKLDCLGIIARLLGAKEYETLFASEETSKVEINASGEINYYYCPLNTTSPAPTPYNTGVGVFKC